eukprot:20457-Heterococcus_DN1.PRE.1
MSSAVEALRKCEHAKCSVCCQAYIEKFKFGTITSEQFEEFTVQYFDSTVLDGLDWHEWFTATGMPKVTPKC